MEQPRRNPHRLKDYDYSTAGAYFITICTQDRKCLLWDDVGASIARPNEVRLSPYGKIVAQAVRQIPVHYPAVLLDNYTIMPNHIHLLLRIDTDPEGHTMCAPTISRVIQQTKGFITKEIGHSIWQKLFHDHVIRNEKDYLKIWAYIDHNPVRWRDDCFYIDEEIGRAMLAPTTEQLGDET